ncbi:MAG: hypothetical protein KF690_04985 [Bacteroidetes bacterium]|nr:hypothetical protein [Bacteroidota bacterium]
MLYRIGDHIQARVQEKRMSVTEFAQAINRSRAVAYSIFERNSLDTELLWSISMVLEYNFFQVVANALPSAIVEPAAAPHRYAFQDELASSARIVQLEREVQGCKRKLALQKEQLQDKTRLIKLLEEKLAQLEAGSGQ